MAVGVTVVATALPAGVAQAAFPGGNGKIAFVSDQGGGTNIFVMNPDGSAPTQLTTTGSDSFPAWSPDGQRIAFQSYRDLGFAEIYVMNADGSQQTRLTTNSAGDYAPTWSPDGQKIAFVSDRDSGGVSGEIYVMNANGSAQTRLTTNVNGDGSPVWSPDGQKIAFVSDRSLNLEIYVMNADGSAQTRLTTNSTDTYAFWPAWSPDGDEIAFAREGPGGARTICVTQAIPGAPQKQLTTNPLLSDDNPAWSPDGQKIVFERSDGVTVDIWTMDAINGSAQMRLPSTLGRNGNPDWQPQPNPIIFVHGFLGSKMVCGSDQLWPQRSLLPSSIPSDGLLDMRLAANGVSNLPGTCGAQVAGIVDEVVVGPFAPEDVYKSTVDFLNRIAPGRNYLFTWDWRTSPAESLARLNTFVDNVRTQHQNAKVVLMAHSMGGLLTRWYIDDQSRADKVARALTIGTPYWGSPKSLFPLAAGVELPEVSDLDHLLDDGNLREFSRNLLGMYFLWPSASYGPWLTLAPPGPGPLDRAGLLDYVGNVLGGNRALLEQALDAHANTLDGFKTNGVDYRVVAGTGLNTIANVVVFEEEVGIRYATGDGTVPGASAVQGTPGTTDPLGEDVPIYYACGVGHVPLPGNPDIDDAIKDFLLNGADVWLSAPGNPGLQSTPCSSSGFQVQIFPLQIGPIAATRTAAVQPTSTVPLTAVSLEDAEIRDLVQVLALPNQTIIVTDTARPVELALPPGPFRLEVTPLNDEEQGATLIYELLNGQLTLAASDTLTVFQDGEEVPPGDHDTTPPTVVGVPDRAPNDAGWYRAPVTIDWQATDDRGSAGDPPDTVASTEGANVVYSSAPSCDLSGNCATGSLTLSVDTGAPIVTVPASLFVDATSPAGAAVSYSASASDLVDPTPSLGCLPASGSVFPIGITVVTCTATDDAGNAASSTFKVGVLGAPLQIVRLIDKTLAFVDLPVLRASLKARLQAVLSALLTHHAPAACLGLNLYNLAVMIAPASALSAAEKAELVGGANRIRAVIGCS